MMCFLFGVKLRYALFTCQIELSLLASSCPAACVWLRDYWGEQTPMCAACTSLHSQVSSKRTVTFLAYLRVYIASVTGKCVELSSRRAASDPALWSSHGRSQSTITERKHTDSKESLRCGVCVCGGGCVCVWGWEGRVGQPLVGLSDLDHNNTF